MAAYINGTDSTGIFYDKKNQISEHNCDSMACCTFAGEQFTCYSSNGNLYFQKRIADQVDKPVEHQITGFDTAAYGVGLGVFSGSLYLAYSRQTDSTIHLIKWSPDAGNFIKSDISIPGPDSDTTYNIDMFEFKGNAWICYQTNGLACYMHTALPVKAGSVFSAGARFSNVKFERGITALPYQNRILIIGTESIKGSWSGRLIQFQVSGTDNGFYTAPTVLGDEELMPKSVVTARAAVYNGLVHLVFVYKGQSGERFCAISTYDGVSWSYCIRTPAITDETGSSLGNLAIGSLESLLHIFVNM